MVAVLDPARITRCWKNSLINHVCATWVTLLLHLSRLPSCPVPLGPDGGRGDADRGRGRMKQAKEELWASRVSATMQAAPPTSLYTPANVPAPTTLPKLWCCSTLVQILVLYPMDTLLWCPLLACSCPGCHPARFWPKNNIRVTAVPSVCTHAVAF